MMQKRRYTPYIAGALTGLLMVITLATTAQFFGTSTSFVRTAGMIEKSVMPSHVADNAYFSKKTPKVDWQWVFVVGILLGAFITAKLRREHAWQAIPSMWRERFGPSLPKRAVVASLGGCIAMIGARLAGGCPSGHGLSGISQMSVGSIIAVLFFFAMGIITAHLIYRHGRTS